MLPSIQLPPNIIKCLPPEERQRYSQSAPPVAAPLQPQNPLSPPPPKRRRSQPEQAIQRAVIEWWSLVWRKFHAPDERVLMHVPNQGIWNQHGGRRRGAMLSGMGLRAGVPDLFLAMPRPGVPFSSVDTGPAGLWIELKAGTRAKVRPEQETLHSALRMAGYEVVVARSTSEALNAIERYLRQ